MNTRVTLSMDKEVVEAAKELARQQNTSLSGLIKNHLLSITGQLDAEGISPLVKSLSGVLKTNEKMEWKKQYTDMLANKYK